MSEPAYLDHTLDPRMRAEDLLNRMTVEEKAGLMFQPAINLPGGQISRQEAMSAAKKRIIDKHISHIHVMDGEDASAIAAWLNELQSLAESTRLKVPVTFSTDPRSGFNSSPFTGDTTNSVSRWPEHIGLAATRDVELVRRYADTIRREMVAMGIRVYLGPMADIFSEPRWSRGFGTFGEDVDLVSQMTAAFIEGLRGGPELSPESVSAIVKHFPGGGPQLRGLDAHDKRHREQVYPGGQQELHLRPFEAAFAAGVTQVMPYYGMPVGTEWQERGFAFNEPVIDGLLRQRYGFDGIVCTDWYLLESTHVNGIPFGPNGHGLEDLSPKQRLKIAVGAGVDQFGGDDCTEYLIELIEEGELSELRIDTSARRILLEKFRLGLFEHRFVDVESAATIAADPERHRLGETAQAHSLTLLKNEDLLPLRPDARVYSEGIDWSHLQTALVQVDSPHDADVNIIRLDAPYEVDPASALGDYFHAGSLEYKEMVAQHVKVLAQSAPTIAVVYLERPAVLASILPHSAAMIGDYGASDSVIVNALSGRTSFRGVLPFDLPRSMEAVEESREDVPFDTVAPLFRHGFGLALAAEGEPAARL